VQSYYLTEGVDLTLNHDHIKPDDLESYSMSALPEESAARVEQHLLVCETCRQNLSAAEAYMAAIKSATRERSQPELAASVTKVKRWRWSFPRLIPAFAALAFLAIAAVTLPLIGRHPPTEPFAVSLQTMRGAENQAEAPSRQPLLLKLDLTGLTELNVYRVEIVDQSGHRVWQGELQSLGATGSMTVPAQKRGSYFVRVSLPSGQALREYGLQLRGTD